MNNGWRMVAGVLTILLALGSASCSRERTGALDESASAVDRDARPADRASAVERRDEQRGAQKLLRAGIQRLLTHGPGTEFRSEVVASGISLQRTEGVAELGRSWSSTTEMTDPSTNDTYVFHALSTQGKVWMQMEGWPAPEAGCWLTMGQGEVPLGVLAMSPDVPAWVALLGALRALPGADPDDVQIAAELPLAAALRLFNGQIFKEMVSVPDTGLKGFRVPAHVALTSGRVTSYEVAADDVVEALLDAGGSASSTAQEVVKDMRFTVNLSPTREGTNIAPPAAHLQYSVGDDGCH